MPRPLDKKPPSALRTYSRVAFFEASRSHGINELLQLHFELNLLGCLLGLLGIRCRKTTARIAVVVSPERTAGTASAVA